MKPINFVQIGNVMMFSLIVYPPFWVFNAMSCFYTYDSFQDITQVRFFKRILTGFNSDLTSRPVVIQQRKQIKPYLSIFFQIYRYYVVHKSLPTKSFIKLFLLRCGARLYERRPLLNLKLLGELLSSKLCV